MKKFNYLWQTTGNKSFFPSSMGQRWIALLVLAASIAGCKKDSTPASGDRDYGYAKIIVKCDKKCNVTYGSGDQLNSFEIEASTATYYQRYQRNYSAEINITPVGDNQNIDLGVYSREEKQIFHNSIVRPANVVWNTKILIP